MRAVLAAAVLCLACLSALPAQASALRHHHRRHFQQREQLFISFWSSWDEAARRAYRRAGRSGSAGVGAPNGMASYYTDTRVACPGEHYRADALAAAHRTLPCGTRVRVCRTRASGLQARGDARERANAGASAGPCVTVRINDRGPYIAGRVIDLTPAGARALDMVVAGVAPVSLEVLGR